jgi:hypothetical protein
MEMMSHSRKTDLSIVALLAGAVTVASCGGGGGGGGGVLTLFRGNVASQTARRPAPESRPYSLASVWRTLSFVGTAHAQIQGIQICIDGADECTFTEENGTFEVEGVVGGNVCLRFIDAELDARTCVADVPGGSVVTLRDINCSRSNDDCTPAEIDVDAPGEE